MEGHRVTGDLGLLVGLAVEWESSRSYVVGDIGILELFYKTTKSQNVVCTFPFQFRWLMVKIVFLNENNEQFCFFLKKRKSGKIINVEQHLRKWINSVGEWRYFFSFHKDSESFNFVVRGRWLGLSFIYYCCTIYKISVVTNGKGEIIK